MRKARKYISKNKAVEAVEALMDREYRKGRASARRENEQDERWLVRTAEWREKSIEEAYQALEDGYPDRAKDILSEHIEPSKWVDAEKLRTYWIEPTKQNAGE